ncbi:alpha/beta hydrolase [Pseudonocardiaceae bacterium YIM PH 21723]|nr:alpha/beta hydrolase [Pseudonocardiaceae bacterium YIM PH 21723]
MLGPLLQGFFALPAPVKRLLAGKPIRIDGQELDLDAQLLVKALRLGGASKREEVIAGRAGMRRTTSIIDHRKVEPVHTRDLKVDTVPGRLYEPDGLATGSPLLLFLHGGGFSRGDLETHDNLCRFLAKNAEVRVLAVDYPLSPESKFPVGVHAAYAAFRWAHENAAELGIDPERIAVGGDSAGGALTATTALLAIREGGPKPKFLLMFYPTTDSSTRHPSRDLFREGFFLTDVTIDWYLDQYLNVRDEVLDPLVSPLLAEDLSGFPPSYVSTAGFDPLRDEAEAFVAKLREQGVPVALTRHRGLFHGYANVFPVSRACREAVLEAVGALRLGLSR